MNKLDLTKKHKAYYTAKKEPEILNIEPANFLSITGKGDPSGQAFSDRMQALYSTAYTLKFMYKALKKDFVVAKLEGLWSFDESKYKNLSLSDAPKRVPRSEWAYRMLIRMPDYVSEEQIQASINTVVTKKEIILAKEVEYYQMTEGKAVQMLHIGPFSKEIETLEEIQEYIKANDLTKNGLHHEIYLSDFRRTHPEKLKTILREPVK